MSAAARYWAVVPAAGTGTRMGSDIPKQYLLVRGKPVIEYALNTFCEHPDISGIVVALSPEDTHWKKLSIAKHKKISTTSGGAERCHSVLNCLRFLSDQASPEDWVLVHDAARPCISAEDISHLITTVGDHAVGGLLGLPVRDTMKRAGQQLQVETTVDRAGLWHALTPQMFRLGDLTRAIQVALENGQLVTDDAQAMERQGMQPLLVEGKPGNIKITRQSDIALAELYLSQL